MYIGNTTPSIASILYYPTKVIFALKALQSRWTCAFVYMRVNICPEASTLPAPSGVPGSASRSTPSKLKGVLVIGRSYGCRVNTALGPRAIRKAATVVAGTLKPE